MEGAPKIRGQHRVSSFEGIPPSAEPINPGILAALDRRIFKAPRPVRDHITNRYCLTNAEHWYRYQEGAEARETKNYPKNESLSAAEKIERRKRAGMHAITKAQTVVWLHEGISRLRTAYLEKSLLEIESGVTLDTEAARYSADAIEDFAITLRGDPYVTLPITPRDDLTRHIEQIGLHATEHPATLADHVGLLQLVLKEQRRRASYWGDVLRTGFQAFGNLLTEPIQEDEITLETLVEQLTAVNNSGDELPQ